MMVRGEGKDREDGKRERRVRVREGECVSKHGGRTERIKEKQRRMN